MKKTEKNLMILTVLFAAALLTSNIISSNGMIITGLFIGDIQLLAPAAVLAYALTFLCTDIIGQIWGKKQAGFAVICGLMAQIVCAVLIAATPLIFNPWFEGSEVYTALNSLGWFTLGSLLAYCASQTWDVFVFHKLKSKINNDKHRWIWNNASTMTSQIIDTVIFIGVGFGIGLNMWGLDLIGLMIGQYIIKFFIALADTPFFYFFTRKRENTFMDGTFD